MRSSIFSVFGGAPDCFGMSGFVLMSFSPALGATFVAVGVDVDVAAAEVRVLACCSAVEANLSASLSFVLLPQAPARSAIAASTAARIRFFVMSVVGTPGPGFRLGDCPLPRVVLQRAAAPEDTKAASIPAQPASGARLIDRFRPVSEHS